MLTYPMTYGHLDLHVKSNMLIYIYIYIDAVIDYLSMHVYIDVVWIRLIPHVIC